MVTISESVKLPSVTLKVTLYVPAPVNVGVQSKVCVKEIEGCANRQACCAVGQRVAVRVGS